MAFPTADQPYDPSRNPATAPQNYAAGQDIGTQSNKWDANQRPDTPDTQWPGGHTDRPDARAEAEDNRPDIQPEKLAEELSAKWSAGGAVEPTDDREATGGPDVRRDPPYQALVRAGKTNEVRKAFRSEGLPRALTEAEQTSVQEDYERLKPEAELAYKKVFNTQTKPEYMNAMAELVIAGLGGDPTPPDPEAPIDARSNPALQAPQA